VSVALGVLMQIAVSVQVADTVPARTPVPIVVRATAQGNTAPQLSTPTATGAVIQLVSDVTRLGGGFGQAVATHEVRYLLRAGAPGTLLIGPVIATLGAQRASSQPKAIVVQSPPSNVVPAIVSRAPVSRENAINFHSYVTRDTVWAGEQVTLQVGIFIDDELRSRLQRNPEYVTPSVDGAVAYDLPVANDALPSREVDGARYRPFIFARALFPLRAGVLAIPPARLGYTLGSAGTLYNRTERQTATTPARSVVVRELPVTGRPASFNGAVGVFSMTAVAEKPAGRVGDAVQVTVRVEGAGNVKLLPPPTLDIPGVTVSQADESIVVDSTDLLVRGSKTFRFLLTPQRDGTLPLGDVRYAFFNPVRGAYEEAVAPLGTLRVAPGTAVLSEPVERAPALPLGGWRAADSDDVTERWWYRIVALAIGLPWLALIVRRIGRMLPTREPRERRRRSRVLPEGTPVSSATLRRAYIERLAPLVHLRSDQPFAVTDVVRRLKRAGATPAAAEAAGALLLRLDLLTFGATTPPDDAAVRALSEEVDAIHAQLMSELSTTVRRRLAAAARVIALAFGAGTTLIAQPRSFVEGEQAYQAARYPAAAIAFATAAATEPMNAVIWANLGAAQWMRADTAGAIVAWQRSARLSPVDNPAVAQLAMVEAPGDIRTQLVPISPNAAWVMLLGLTALLSVAAAVWRWRNRHLSNPALFAATALVAAAAVLAVIAQRAAEADGLVVVRRDVALRTEPVLAGEASARARAGELAVVVDSSASWLRVAVTGGREGWVEAEALRSLAISDGRDVATAEARLVAEPPSP
jgi:Bacterial SH3 domain